MRCLNLSTNVSLEGVDTSSILSEATSTVAKLIGKPEAYFMIVLKGSVPMSFGWTEHPTAYDELVSIGGLNPDVNKKLNILVAKLNVPKSCFFLKFYDTKGWRGLSIKMHNGMAGKAAFVIDYVERHSSFDSIEVEYCPKAVGDLYTMQIGFQDVLMFLLKPNIRMEMALYKEVQWDGRKSSFCN